ncbi:hypothetical protein PG989_014858 [Apiospora arundinis]
MFSRRLLTAARVAQLRRPMQQPLRGVPLPAMLNQVRTYADTLVKVPQMAESISEGTLKQWNKQIGDYVEADEEIATIETDKASMHPPGWPCRTLQIDVAVNAPEAGIIKELMANEEDTVTVGQEIAKIEAGAAPEGGNKSEGKDEAPKEETASTDAKPAEPKEESKPEPKQESKPESSKPAPKPEPKKETPKQSGKDSASAGPTLGSREERRVKMNRMRLRIAERLKQSQNTAASLTTFNEVDMSSLMEFRKLYKDEILKKQGVKLGFMSAFARACVLAMRDIPVINASIEGENGGDTIVYRDYLPLRRVLLPPIVRNVENMDMINIESSIAELGKKARDNKLTIEDMAGGTFTISNGGVFGSLMGTPIINLPQTAVLGLHAIKEKPVAINGKVEIRPMMYLALTYDHRLLDGREAVQFLVKVKEYIEDPRRMLL